MKKGEAYESKFIRAVNLYTAGLLPCPEDIFSIIFADCSDNITPKEYVNLRTEPSTSQGEATVRCQVKSGETVRRTGYSADSGWSRVEYNGEVLYVVSSLMKAVQ